MTSPDAGDTENKLTGGTQLGPVIQARDVHNPIFNTVRAAAPVALAQLPAPVAGFTGRQTELAEVTGLLDPAAGAGAVVVSAVAGLAGVGKTALAIQAAHAALAKGWFGGGVLFLDLHGYDDQAVQPAQALDALLRALGVPAEHIPAGTEERAGLYRSALAAIADPVLIVADNASAEAQVRPLLPGTGPHRVLVTSRHTLAGLGARLLDVEILDEHAAIAVVEKTLRATRPGDDRITGDADAARRLAAACGGLPLALRITAALLAADSTLTAAELAGQLAGEIGRLGTLQYDDGGGTSAPSVAAAFDLSYRRLDEAAAELFRLLPVDMGPDVSTAAAVALAGQPAGPVRTILGRLVQAHLVEPAGTGAGRWRMHDLLRLYARQLPATPSQAEELEQARDRLLDYYLGGARAGDAHVRALPGTPVPERFAGREQALAWLDSERPSLIAAVTMAASTGRHRIAIVLPLILGVYMEWRRRFDDWLAMLDISRNIAHRLGAREQEAAALSTMGNALRQVRRYDEAIIACQQSVVLFRESENRHAEAMALENLGLALRYVRRPEDAITAIQSAVDIYRETGDRHLEGQANNNLGSALREANRLDESIRAHNTAAAIYRETRDRRGEGNALNNLGLALAEVNRLTEAITAFQRAAEIYRETTDRHGEGRVLGDLGSALGDMKRYGEAITALQTATEIYRETDDPHGEGEVLETMGITLSAMGCSDEAIAAHQGALAILRETGDKHGEGMALANLGSALRKVGRFDEAITVYADAVSIFRETSDRQREDVAVNVLKQVRAAKAEADSQ